MSQQYYRQLYLGDGKEGEAEDDASAERGARERTDGEKPAEEQSEKLLFAMSETKYTGGPLYEEDGDHDGDLSARYNEFDHQSDRFGTDFQFPLDDTPHQVKTENKLAHSQELEDALAKLRDEQAKSQQRLKDLEFENREYQREVSAQNKIIDDLRNKLNDLSNRLKSSRLQQEQPRPSNSQQRKQSKLIEEKLELKEKELQKKGQMIEFLLKRIRNLEQEGAHALQHPQSQPHSLQHPQS